MNDTPTPTQSDGRHALWAALLSLCQPGLGQVYAGAWLLGIVPFVIAMAGLILLFAITRIAAPTPASVAVFTAVAVAFGLFSLVPQSMRSDA